MIYIIKTFCDSDSSRSHYPLYFYFLNVLFQDIPGDIISGMGGK